MFRQKILVKHDNNHCFHLSLTRILPQIVFMPKQGNHLNFFFSKTITNLTLYVRQGVGLARHRTSLTGERWRTDPKFAGSRHSAACLATAAQMASRTYRSMPADKRRVSHYRQLVGWIKKHLSAGMPVNVIEEKLDNLLSAIHKTLRPVKRQKSTQPVVSPPASLVVLLPRPGRKWPRSYKVYHRRTLAG